VTVCLEFSNGNVASWCFGWLPTVYDMDILGCALRDSHRVLNMALLQFNYLYYEVRYVVVALLCWMNNPAF
jgi:hypothetical protein